MWLARDKNNRLYLYESQPYEWGGKWGLEQCPDTLYIDKHTGEHEFWTEIPSCMFPEVTFENSPKELSIVPED